MPYKTDQTSSSWGRVQRATLFFWACLLLVGVSMAQEPIPKKSGISGFLHPGLGVLWIKSNLIAGNRMLDFGNARVSSLYDEPELDTSGVPVLSFELRYTFAKSRTQVFAGSALEDVIRFVLTTQLGVRQELPGSGTLSLSYLFGAVPTKVWSDPYVVDQDRVVTRRHSPGVRLTWDRMLGTDFQLRYTYRSIGMEQEQSGAFLGLPEEQAAYLYRDGKQHTAELIYILRLGEGHVLAPTLHYDRYDLTGQAMSNHHLSFQLTYTYLTGPARLILNGFLSRARFDGENPIYLKTRSDIRYGLAAAIYYRNPFGWKPFGSERFNVFWNIACYRSDTNIPFYDFYGTLSSAGVFFRF